LIFEADFLDGSERMAKPGTDFKEAVTRRLRAGQELYGDKWAHMTVSRLLREIREEGLDLGAWSALAGQHSASIVGRRAAPQVVLMLQEIAAHGAKVDALVKQFRDELALVSYRAGAVRERQVQDQLERNGWVVTRCAGSKGHGAYDLHCSKAGYPTRLVQVKATAAGPFSGFPPAERRELLEAARGCRCEAELCWWPSDRKGCRWLPGPTAGRN
jgi:Holliday junction resolvase